MWGGMSTKTEKEKPGFISSLFPRVVLQCGAVPDSNQVQQQAESPGHSEDHVVN